MSDSYCVILTTAGSQDEANRLAELLVTGNLAACVQIASITSTYTWKGQLNKESEYLLLIKTVARLYQAVESAIVTNHSYEVPEVVLLPIAQGLDGYLGWISANTKPAKAG